jgi:hypothetical protein
MWIEIRKLKNPCQDLARDKMGDDELRWWLFQKIDCF